jgi:prevent-host-death family protein
MRSVGLFQAKSELSALVERVSKGEEVMITRRGQKVAMLVPANRGPKRAAREVVEHIRKARKGARLPKGYTLRRLVEEGRWV